MATQQWPADRSPAPGATLATLRYAPRRHRTSAGVVTIDLLRRLAPAHLVLPEGGAIAYEDWHQHGQQASSFVLVATRPVGGKRQVLGELELSVKERDPATGQPRCGMIDRVLVQPEYRRLGLGTKLVGAAIGFARDNGFAALREYIPNLLARPLEEAGRPGRWALYEPVAGELGGVRSLGATAKACALEGQPCAVARVTRERYPNEQAASDDGPRQAPQERIGAVLELPIGAPQPQRDARGDEAGDEVLARLEVEIAALAGIDWPGGRGARGEG